MTDSAPLSEISAVNIVLFEISGRTFGADLKSVASIGRSQNHAPTLLGEAQSKHRGLAFWSEGGSVDYLSIDHFHGVHRVPFQELRRIPSLVRCGRGVLGIWLRPHSIVILVELHLLHVALKGHHV
jgi:hypothetical protein